jgi:hypothetical protein
VALVCQNLKKIPRWNTVLKLIAFPLRLVSLYERILKQICDSDNTNLCKYILALIAIVYQPIPLKELTSLIEVLEGMFDDLESLREIIGLCSSFLTIREEIVYFVQAGHVWVARYNYTTLGHGDGSSAADTRGPLS